MTKILLIYIILVFYKTIDRPLEFNIEMTCLKVLQLCYLSIPNNEIYIERSNRYQLSR